MSKEKLTRSADPSPLQHLLQLSPLVELFLPSTPLAQSVHPTLLELSLSKRERRQ